MRIDRVQVSRVLFNTHFPNARSAFFSPVFVETDETPLSSPAPWPLCCLCCTLAPDDVAPCAPDECGERGWCESDASAVSPLAWASRPTWASVCTIPDRTRNGRRHCRRPRRSVCAYVPIWADLGARASDPREAAGAAGRGAVAIRPLCCHSLSSDSVARCSCCRNPSCWICSRARFPDRARPQAQAPIGHVWRASAAALLSAVRPVVAARTWRAVEPARIAWTRRELP